MGASVVPIIAGAAAAARARVLERFRVLDATKPERAQTLESMGLSDDAALARLQRAGIVQPGLARDTLFLDEVALAASHNSGRQRALLLALAGMAIMVAVGLWAFIMARQVGARLPTH